MKDPFLIKVRVATETDAMRNALRAALQRNLVYREGVDYNRRKQIRSLWAQQIRRCASIYKSLVSEEEHVSRIDSICCALSAQHSPSLVGGRLRFGTSQKALNLYLKFLWRLGLIPCPPHCPVDRVILSRADLAGSWTLSDSADEYIDWLAKLKRVAAPHSVAEWEYDLWNKAA